MSCRQRATACSVRVCVRGKSRSPACSEEGMQAGRGLRYAARGGEENNESTGDQGPLRVICRGTPSALAHVREGG